MGTVTTTHLSREGHRVWTPQCKFGHRRSAGLDTAAQVWAPLQSPAACGLHPCKQFGGCLPLHGVPSRESVQSPSLPSHGPRTANVPIFVSRLMLKGPGPPPAPPSSNDLPCGNNLAAVVVPLVAKDLPVLQRLGLWGFRHGGWAAETKRLDALQATQEAASLCAVQMGQTQGELETAVPLHPSKYGRRARGRCDNGTWCKLGACSP